MTDPYSLKKDFTYQDSHGTVAKTSTGYFWYDKKGKEIGSYSFETKKFYYDDGDVTIKVTPRPYGKIYEIKKSSTHIEYFYSPTIYKKMVYYPDRKAKGLFYKYVKAESYEIATYYPDGQLEVSIKKDEIVKYDPKGVVVLSCHPKELWSPKIRSSVFPPYVE